MADKVRLDVYMAEHKLAESREKAKALIMSGIVYVDNQKCDKAGTMVDGSKTIEVRGSTLKYVSRGGLKLEKAVTAFGLDLKDKICMDVGASTGGFTDCMLQNGAAKVYAVDVGYGQLAWKLRTDERVVNMERTNIRHVEQVADRLDFVSIDVAFISLRLVLPVVQKLLAASGEIVALIKPQFEAGREKVGKKGVVRDIAVHREVVEGIYRFAVDSGFSCHGLTYSPIKGPEGNIEYLIYLKAGGKSTVGPECAVSVVEQSHETLAQ